MLRIEIAKRADRAGVLACTRADGSQTWQKQSTRTAAHFALHDLTHYAVESTLGYENGFFGLIASGWEIEDTTGKGARGPLPPEAVEVETGRRVMAGDVADASGTERTAYEPTALNGEVVVYRITGALFFGATAAVSSALDSIGQHPAVFVLDFSDVPLVDSTAAKALEADGAALANRRDQTTADIEYASGFSKVHETIQGGAAALTSVAGASLAKKLGRLH